MKLRDYSSHKPVARHSPEQEIRPARHLQAAADRVLLYLRCLDFPATQALELALTALKAAEQNMHQDSGETPTAAAMQAMHALLRSQKSGPDGNDGSPAGRCDLVVPSAPALHRLPMITEEMAPARWLALLTNFLKRFRLRSSRG